MKKKIKPGRHLTTFWERGQVRQLAELAGIHKQTMYNILARRRGVGPNTAALLEQASKAVLGFPIAWSDWMLSKETNHPAFKPLVPGISSAPKPDPPKPLDEDKSRVYVRDIIQKLTVRKRMELMHNLKPKKRRRAKKKGR